MASTTRRISRLRGRPPGLAAGIRCWIISHWLSVKSVGYRFVFTETTYTTIWPTAFTFQTASEGRPGPVLKVSVERRTGSERSFTQALRKSLQAHPEIGGDGAPAGARQVGLGGVFVIEAGRIRSHVMSDYECIAHRYYDTEAEEVVAEFLQFYEHMGPDLLCFAVCWTGDPTGGQLHLRESGEHTHFFHMGELSQAGHYHYDVSPDTIRYAGYFNVAAELVRIGDVYAELERQSKNTDKERR